MTERYRVRMMTAQTVVAVLCFGSVIAFWAMGITWRSLPCALFGVTNALLAWEKRKKNSTPYTELGGGVSEVVSGASGQPSLPP